MRPASSDWAEPISCKAACKRLANSIRIASGGAADDIVPLWGGGMCCHPAVSEPTRYVVEHSLSTTKTSSMRGLHHLGAAGRKKADYIHGERPNGHLAVASVGQDIDYCSALVYTEES
jgi:hypothetical protein